MAILDILLVTVMLLANITLKCKHAKRQIDKLTVCKFIVNCIYNGRHFEFKELR